MTTGKSTFLKLVEEGREGKNVGFTIGSEKLELYMDGFLPGTSYLIGGGSGSGKSTYALWAFIYNPLIAFLNGIHKERDPYWVLFNLEMTQPQIYAKLLSMYIFDKYHIELRFKEIFSRGENTILTDEHYKIIKDNEAFLDILDERLICFDGNLNPDKYFNKVLDITKRFGTWEDDNYTPNNPQQIIGVLIDHMNLIRSSSGHSKKENIDIISGTSVVFRNKTGIISPIHIAQFNRNSKSDERLKQSLQDPTDADFKETGSIYEDSQIVLAVYSPYKYKLSNFRGYDIKILEQCFVAIFLLKSRFGNSDITVPMGFYGDCSHFLEIPKPDKIYDYEKYKTPYWSIEDSNNVNIKDNNDEKSNSGKPKFLL